jgi:hypothetical protein
LLAATLLTGCTVAPSRVETPARDQTKEAWYSESVDQLKAFHREADVFFRRGKSEEAAELIKKAQPLMNRVLLEPRATLAAMEAASDLDDLYGRMLLANRHYGWARMFFQKNAARWKTWTPATDDTERRRKAAEAGIAECDRGMLKK